MLALLLAAAIGASPPDAPHAALVDMMRQEGVCSDASAGACARAAATAQIRRLGSVGGEEIALVSFAYDNVICGNVNCPYFVVAVGPGAVRKLLWTDGFSIAVESGSPLPALRVTSHDSADTDYVARFDWRGGEYVRTEYLRVRLATGEMRPASIPVEFAPGASSAVLRGTLTHYWNATYELAARGGQRLTITNVKAPMPLWIMLDGPDGLPVTSRAAPGTPYALPSAGAYELTVYLDTAQDVERDLPFQLTVTIR